MIPILYGPDETKFITNGLGRLSDCTRCIVTEERNGKYECEFDYPLTGAHFEEIQYGRIVGCTHDDNHDIQPFVIYSRSVPDLNGIVTFYAHHISYRLNKIVVTPFTSGSITDAFAKLRAKSINGNPFKFWTDKTTTGNFEVSEPKAIRGLLGGEEGSILDVFGAGDYKFDKFTVRLYAHRGVDSDVEIRYSKNLTDLEETTDVGSTYNAIVPFWKDTEGNFLMLPEKIIVYSGVEPVIAYLTDHNQIIIRTETDEPIEVAYSTINAVPYDMSSYFDEKPTVVQLRQAAQTRFENSNAWLPDENLTVDFVQLWQTEEFKDYAAMQRVGLCDTVSVYYDAAGIRKVKQRVIKVVYNVLLDRYDSIELGQPQTSLGQAIRQDILQEVPTTSMMEEAIQYATEMIRGGLGGYVVMTPGPNGYPQEILIMDTPDVNTAVNVWRFNQGGLGHSSNGYEGPFSDIALTQDGRINASLITTGILNANLIRTGVLQDYGENTSFDLSTGLFTMKRGLINLGNGNFIATDAGKLTSIGGGLIRDASSNIVINLDTGQITILKGSINLGNGNFKATNTGELTALGGGAIQDVTGDNSWNLTTGVFSTKKGYIGGFTIGSSALTYQSNVRNVVFSNSQISYAASFTDNSRRGIAISSNYISFQDRADESSWSLAERAFIFYDRTGPYMALSSNGGMWFFVNGTIRLELSSTTPHAFVNGGFACSGAKNRVAKTKNYSERLLYSYETPAPLFGDIGEAVLDEEGICYVDLDDIFTETIAEKVEYQVFLQKEGEGDCWIAGKDPRFFVIQGTPGLRVAWELKAKQKDYEAYRLEPWKTGLEEYAEISESENIETYIKEQEELLYG